MSTESATQNMAQQNQQDGSYDPSVTSTKRKRGRPRKEGRPRKDGRPRKEEPSRSEPNKRRKQCTVPPSPSSYDGLVGQEVSCSFIGVFDAGYLLTVQVGNSGPILTGLVFDPRLCVPVSAENDIAPHLPMIRRNGFSPPVEKDFINQGADSSQAPLEEDFINQGADSSQNAEIKQHIQAKEFPTASSFTSHVQTDLQLNMMEEVTPIQNSHVPQTTSETMEAQNDPKTLKIFLEGPIATETSDQLTSSCDPQPQAKSEHAPATNPSNGYNPSDFPMVTSSEVSKPTNTSDPTLEVPKEAQSKTPEASLDVSNDGFFDISMPSDNSKEVKPSEASADTQKITLDISAFGATHDLQHQTLKTGNFPAANLSLELSSQRTEEPSEDPKVDESLGDGFNPVGSASSG